MDVEKIEDSPVVEPIKDLETPAISLLGLLRMLEYFRTGGLSRNKRFSLFEKEKDSFVAMVKSVDVYFSGIESNLSDSVLVENLQKVMVDREDVKILLSNLSSGVFCFIKSGTKSKQSSLDIIGSSATDSWYALKNAASEVVKNLGSQGAGSNRAQ